jgi:UDP-N-acetyl-D-galactosamine dehydrogenase
LVTGVTFKKHCPDVHSTKVIDVIKALKDCGVNITIFDPWVEPHVVMHEYGLTIPATHSNEKFDWLVQAVSQNEFKTQIIH